MVLCKKLSVLRLSAHTTPIPQLTSTLSASPIPQLLFSKYSTKISNLYQYGIIICPKITIVAIAASFPLLIQFVPIIGKYFVKCDSSIIAFVVSFLLAQRLGISSSSTAMLDDLAWRYFLPASVAAGIISSSLQAYMKTSSNNTATNTVNSDRLILIKTMIAFAFGSIGSLLGGVSAMIMFTKLATFTSSSSSLPDIHKLAAGLIASYIGGTANLFETMHLLRITEAGKSMLQLLAVMDIFVMIVYFAVLQLFQNQPTLYGDPATREGKKSYEVSNISKVIMVVISAMIAGSITTFGQTVQQQFLPYPGVAIFVIIFLSSIVAKSSMNIVSYKKGREDTRSNYRDCLNINSVVTVFSGISSWCLHLFYASLSSQIHWRQLLLPNECKIVLCLFLNVLSVHLGSIFGLTALWNWTVSLMTVHTKKKHRRKYGVADCSDTTLATASENKNINSKDWTIDRATMLIASNACVGGSATAVSMATSPAFQRADLMLPASIAGITGYVIGTPLAVALYRCVSAWLTK